MLVILIVDGKVMVILGTVCDCFTSILGFGLQDSGFTHVLGAMLENWTIEDSFHPSQYFKPTTTKKSSVFS